MGSCRKSPFRVIAEAARISESEFMEYNAELLVVIEADKYEEALDAAEEVASEIAEMYASDERVLLVTVEAIGDRRIRT